MTYRQDMPARHGGMTCRQGMQARHACRICRRDIHVQGGSCRQNMQAGVGSTEQGNRSGRQANNAKIGVVLKVLSNGKRVCPPPPPDQRVGGTLACG
jgi:hypothetical protein